MEHCLADLQEVGEGEMAGGLGSHCRQSNQEGEVQRGEKRGVGVKIWPQNHLKHTNTQSKSGNKTVEICVAV